MKRRVTAVEARRKLGELLEGVHYRNDEVVIERGGKVMGVVVPAYLYANLEREREELFAFIHAAQERNKDVPPEVIEREIAEAIADVRRERRALRDGEQRAAK